MRRMPPVISHPRRHPGDAHRRSDDRTRERHGDRKQTAVTLNSLREIVESSPQMRALRMHSLNGEECAPQPLAPARWEWKAIERVLVVRLRSIGDTVLATPSLFALKRFLPHAKVDILLEDWVAPVL